MAWALSPNLPRQGVGTARASWRTARRRRMRPARVGPGSSAICTTSRRCRSTAGAARRSCDSRTTRQGAGEAPASTRAPVALQVLSDSQRVPREQAPSARPPQRPRRRSVRPRLAQVLSDSPPPLLRHLAPRRAQARSANRLARRPRSVRIPSVRHRRPPRIPLAHRKPLPRLAPIRLARLRRRRARLALLRRRRRARSASQRPARRRAQTRLARLRRRARRGYLARRRRRRPRSLVRIPLAQRPPRVGSSGGRPRRLLPADSLGPHPRRRARSVPRPCSKRARASLGSLRRRRPGVRTRLPPLRHLRLAVFSGSPPPLPRLEADLERLSMRVLRRPLLRRVASLANLRHPRLAAVCLEAPQRRRPRRACSAARARPPRRPAAGSLAGRPRRQRLAHPAAAYSAAHRPRRQRLARPAAACSAAARPQRAGSAPAAGSLGARPQPAGSSAERRRWAPPPRLSLHPSPRRR